MILFVGFPGLSWYLGPLGCVVIPILLQLDWDSQARRRGGWRYMMQLLFGRLAGSWGLNNQQQQQRQQQPRQQGQQQQQQHNQQQQQQQRRRATFDEVVHAIQALPLEKVETQEQLLHLSVHELRQRLAAAGLDGRSCLEKGELVQALLEAGGSSGSTCSICCEDYGPEDVLRVLPCKHRFHLECVDRWFLSSTDYSRPPACPMCNHELLPQPPGSPSARQQR